MFSCSSKLHCENKSGQDFLGIPRTCFGLAFFKVGKFIEIYSIGNSDLINLMEDDGLANVTHYDS